MVKVKGFIIAATFISSMSLITSCTSTHHEASANEYINSSATTLKIKDNFLRDPKLASYRINVSTYQDTVTLSGSVDNEAQEERAIEITRGVRGVKYVVDNLEIRKLRSS